jgi:ferric-dicitrate binding protein FerR (iron transport regulator)
MRQRTDEHSHLAGAFLALSDDPAPAPPSQRSAARALCALVAGVVLALAAPVAWASPAPGDLPAATAAGKAAEVEDEPESA